MIMCWIVLVLFCEVVGLKEEKIDLYSFTVSPENWVSNDFKFLAEFFKKTKQNNILLSH